ncbi:MAG: T9SS type A sorting domain-containing protein [Saprospiraceae bacterium]|nr:T9SS type A sorting domain-containing protein [Saprospiraceae bacterium]
MNKQLFTLFVLWLLAQNGLRAQNGVYWEEVPGPDGGWVWEMTATSSGRLYAQMYRGDIYRSDDEGANWTAVDSLNLTVFTDHYSIYIGKAGTAFAQKSDIWYRSEDEGASWQALGPAVINAPPFEAQIVKFVESASGVLTGFANGQFFFSEDKGDTWMEASAPAAIPYEFPTIKLLQNGVAMITPEAYFQKDSLYTFFRSFDEGRSWSEYQVVFPISTSGDLSFSPSGAAFIFNGSTPILRSAGSGQPFVQVPCDSLPIYTQPYFPYPHDLVVLPTGRLLKPESYNMLYSDDDGLTWHRLEGYNLEGANHGNTYLFPNSVLPDGQIFMNKGAAGIYKSSDLGKTWNLSSKNIRCSQVFEMAFETDSIYYAVAPSGLWKTENKGNLWYRLTNPISELQQQSNGGGFWNFLHLDRPDRLLMGENDQLLFSTNGGDTFENVKPSGSNNYYSGFWDPYIVSTSKDLYINNYKSSDSGVTWQYSGAPSSVLRAPSGKFFGLYFGSGVALASSDDEGNTWTSQDPIPGINWAGKLKAAPEGTLYFIAGWNFPRSAFLYKSEDGGESWSKQLIPSVFSSNDVYFFFEVTDLGHLVLKTNSNTYLSLNKGASWQNLPKRPVNLYEYSQEFIRFSISPDQYLYTCTSTGRLYKTRNPISSGSYLRGSVRLDADADCSTEDATAPLKNWIVEADGDGGQTYTTSDSLGHYVMLLDTGIYNISLQTPNAIWWEACDSVKVFQADTLYSSDTLNFSAAAQSECPLMSVDVSAPFLRRCFDNTIYFQYCNLGSELADSAWIDVTLDPFLNLQSCPLPYTSLGNNVFRVALGDVAQGDCGQFSMVVNVSCDSTIIGQTHCISAHAFPDTLCTILPDWSGANIEAEVICQDTIIQLQIRNTGTSTSETLEYIIFEDDVVLMTGQETYDAFEDITLNFAANGHTWRIESEQEPGHPFSTRAIAFAEGCGGFESLGFINQFSLNGIHPSVDVDCRENIGSYDPNDKQGFPLGTGSDHEIRPGQELEYMIRFQNTGTDTAFKVVVCDTLSALLDPATVRPGASSHAYTWDLSGNGTATFTFANIALPDSNASQAGSQGFITFKVQQRAALPLGSVIYNSAGIFFDFNTAVITNQTWHTVALPSTSTVTHSPASADTYFDLRVSPNPASDFLLLESPSAAIRAVEISNGDGSLRALTQIGNPARQIRVALGDMPSGTYFARVFCGEGVAVKKFVITR